MPMLVFVRANFISGPYTFVTKSAIHGSQTFEGKGSGRSLCLADVVNGTDPWLGS